MRSTRIFTPALALCLAGCGRAPIGAVTTVGAEVTAESPAEDPTQESTQETIAVVASGEAPTITGPEVTPGPEAPPESAVPVEPGVMTIDNTLSDHAQATTIAFDALSFMTGSLCADSFFPPGKVSDFFGFQYLRDNEPDGFGHNTAFAATVGENVLSILDDAQVGDLVDLALAQVTDINEYAHARFPLMEAFRRLLDGDLPEGSSGLSATAMADYSAEVYRLDGEISFERARVFTGILESMSPDQQAQLAGLASTSVAGWPDHSRDPDVEAWRQQLDHDAHVALMTYAGQLFSWYAGDLDADTYFCPERHGTYFGSFYMKDIPAMLSQQAGTDISINENLTGEYGDRFLETLTPAQRSTIEALVDEQRPLMSELVETREAIAAQLRLLWAEPGVDEAVVEAAVLAFSERYGEIDAEIVKLYVTAFEAVYDDLTAEQINVLWDLRQGPSELNLSAGFGDPCSLTPDDLAYLYSREIDMPEVEDTDFLFGP